ncbi:unnamed protein product [Clonostachys rhizophaga]|uniref:Acyl-CoA dehydrogenase/oxidase C-terminal domain-containing protein n=1 Tax=Clonostachys rhizophaga TaxID=160324 RepID=A0A9N9YC07_9HYPO|nr:unnamed protein product [Clonostachys rhizophaga]
MHDKYHIIPGLGLGRQYAETLVGFPLGMFAVVIFWLLSNRYHNNHILRKAHPVVMMDGGLIWALYNISYNLMPHTMEWKASQMLPNYLYKKAAEDGVVMPMAAGPEIPQEWRGTYPIIGNVAPEEWNGFHGLIIHDEFGRVGGIGIENGLVGGKKYGLQKIKDIFSAKPRQWITSGMYSDYLVTLVKEMTGEYMLLVVQRREGLMTKHITLSGLTAAGTAFVDFDNVKVPMNMVVGQCGQGFSYAMNRGVFGKKLIDYSVIRLKMANMSWETEALQLWVESVIFQLPKPTLEEGVLLLAGITAQLKAYSGIVLETVASEVIQIMGGIGLTRGGWGERVECIWRDVKVIVIPGGSEDSLLNLGSRWTVKISK